MRIRPFFLVALLVTCVTGCGTDESDLQRENAELTSSNTELNRDLATRDQYIEEIVSTINNVYTDLESARAKEKKVLKQTEPREMTKMLTSAEVRQQIVNRITEIGGVLQESRKKIAGLESRLRSSEQQYESLEQLVASLKQNLEEREQVIATLDSTVKDLQANIDEKARMVAQKDSMIHEQWAEMNTAYYIIGTRDELKNKGIIVEEGGFLWGLLGSTTILASGVEVGHFRPIDKTAATMLTVEGEVEEIVPKRKGDYYQTDSIGDESTVRIVDPSKFWQDKYLVIIKG